MFNTETAPMSAAAQIAHTAPVCLGYSSSDADLLAAALADLETVTGAVFEHNTARMKHSHVRAWLLDKRLEPRNKDVGIVSTAPAVRIWARIDRGEVVTIAEVSRTIVLLKRNIMRACQHEEENSLIRSMRARRAA